MFSFEKENPCYKSCLLILACPFFPKACLNTSLKTYNLKLTTPHNLRPLALPLSLLQLGYDGHIFITKGFFMDGAGAGNGGNL